MDQRQSTSIPPTIPEVRCPGCLNLMNVKEIETKPKSIVELTYRCERCEVTTKRIVMGNEK